MRSSTLRFRQRIPWLLVRLLCVALLVLAGSILYTFRLNPEVAFCKAAAEGKLLWTQKMTHEFGRKVVVYGGSSCMFSIDTERLVRQDGLPAVNAGLLAGMGPTVLTRFAISQTKPGDTLVVALEPGLLGTSLENPSLGIQFSLAMGHPEWLDGFESGEKFPRLSALLALRPGGYHLFTLLGKAVSGKPLYRYSAADLHPGGWMQTAVRMPFPPNGPAPTQLPLEARIWLRDLRGFCRHRGIELVYSLPWAFVPPENLFAARQTAAGFLLEISAFMPVLKDPELGSHPLKEHFADTAWHLTTEGARLRTDGLADQIQNRLTWTSQELVSLASGGRP